MLTGIIRCMFAACGILDVHTVTTAWSLCELGCDGANQRTCSFISIWHLENTVTSTWLVFDYVFLKVWWVWWWRKLAGAPSSEQDWIHQTVRWRPAPEGEKVARESPETFWWLLVQPETCCRRDSSETACNDKTLLKYSAARRICQQLLATAENQRVARETVDGGDLC